MDKLPGFIGEKLADLIETRDQLRSWAGAALSRAEHDRMRIGTLKADLQSARGSAPAMAMVGPQHGPSDEHVAEVHRAIGELEQKVDASIAEFARRRAFADSADAILTTCRDWLLRLPEQTVLEPLPVPISNGDLRKMLDLTRRDLAAEQSKLARLRALPLPLPEIEQRVKVWVAGRAAAQRLTLRAPRREPLEVSFGIASALGPQTARADPLTLLCMIDPARMIDLLLTEAKRHPFANDGVGDESFDEQVATLNAKIDELSWIEECCASKLMAESVTATQRRNDANPRIVLGVRIVTKSARAVRAAA